jgi:predicted Zn-dependent protease
MAVLERECIEALEILGHIYFLQGRSTEARIVFNGILELDEGNQAALKHLAALSLENGAGAEAMRQLDVYAALVEKETGGADPCLWLMRAKALHQEGRAAEAGESLAEYVRRSGTEW